MTDVAVCIVHTSRPDLTLECLASLAADDPRVGLEVVVLDNAGEGAIAKRIAERFSEVRVIEQARRTGFGAANNVLVRATNSRYLFLLNPDTRVGPGAIDALAEHLDAHPEAAIVGPLVRGFDGVQQGSAWRLPTVPVQLVWALTLGRYGAVVSHGAEPRHVGAVSACAMLVRRAALEAVGMFDESYFMFGEEAELGQRLSSRRFSIDYLPTAEVLHLGQGSTDDLPERQVNEMWRSFDLYFDRYHTPAAAWLLRRLTGLGYALALGAAAVGTRLPDRIRPSAAASWAPRTYRLHARNGLLGVRGPGLREVADALNATSGLHAADLGRRP